MHRGQRPLFKPAHSEKDLSKVNLKVTQRVMRSKTKRMSILLFRFFLKNIQQQFLKLLNFSSGSFKAHTPVWVLKHAVVLNEVQQGCGPPGEGGAS